MSSIEIWSSASSWPENDAVEGLGHPQHHLGVGGADRHVAGTVGAEPLPQDPDLEPALELGVVGVELERRIHGSGIGPSTAFLDPSWSWVPVDAAGTGVDDGSMVDRVTALLDRLLVALGIGGGPARGGPAPGWDPAFGLRRERPRPGLDRGGRGGAGPRGGDRRRGGTRRRRRPRPGLGLVRLVAPPRRVGAARPVGRGGRRLRRAGRLDQAPHQRPPPPGRGTRRPRRGGRARRGDRRGGPVEGRGTRGGGRRRRGSGGGHPVRGRLGRPPPGRLGGRRAPRARRADVAVPAPGRTPCGPGPTARRRPGTRPHPGAGRTGGHPAPRRVGCRGPAHRPAGVGRTRTSSPR